VLQLSIQKRICKNSNISGRLRFAAGKCIGENGGTVAAGGITSKPSTPTTSSEINCQSNKGTENTANPDTLNFAGGKCIGENGGTVAAGESNPTQDL
jgi:hypothetical protein